MNVWRHLVSSALLSAIALAAVAAGMLALPAATRALFERSFSERIAVESAARLMDGGERLAEIRAFLDREIQAGTYDARIHALRGRLVGIEEGPDAGFRYFTDLFQRRSHLEQTHPVIEFARMAGLGQRWSDFFALCRLLADYGKEDALRELLAEMRDAGSLSTAALASPEASRFLVSAGWDKEPEYASLPMSATEELERRLWQAERDLRLDGVAPPPSLAAMLRQGGLNDPRTLFIESFSHNPLVGRSPGRFPAPELPEKDRLLAPTDFRLNGRAMESGWWSSAGAYSAMFPTPAPEVWAVMRGVPLLTVHPLLLVELDGEMLIVYPQHEFWFPERLRRRDGEPFRNIVIHYVNDFRNEEAGMDRDLVVQSVWSAGG